MSHALYKKLTTDTSTPSSDENSTMCPRLLKAGSCHLTKKFFLLQRQITLVQAVTALVIICIILLILTQNLTQTLYMEKNIESSTREQTSSLKYTSVPHVASDARVATEIIPRVIMSRGQMEDIRKDLNNRKQRVVRICKIINSEKSYLNATLRNMIIDIEHNISWCPIYKAASSTWMNYFAVLKGSLTGATMDLVRRNLVQISDIVKQKFPHDADLYKTYEKIIRTKTFLIVRHPLERLLSAYRDKLEHVQGREYYYKRFGRRIAFKYRQFNNETKLEPTFEEFLRFIVKERYFDEHWAPYYQTCEPCIVHYDYILKFETLDRDQNYFIQDANLSRYLYENYRNINSHGTTTKEIFNKYIKKIPRALLNEINQIYENDYKLFDYSFV